MSISKAQDLRREARELTEKNRQLVDTIEEEQDGVWQSSQEEEWEDRDDAIDEKLERAERLEAQHDRDEAVAEIMEARARTQDGDAEEAVADTADGERLVDSPRYKDAWMRWARSIPAVGFDVMTPEDRQLVREVRAQSVGTDNKGGHTVPTEIASRIEEALKAFGGVRRAGATVERTSHGRDIDYPTSDDTGNTASILGENTGASTTDVTFGSTTIPVYKYSSDFIKVSFELLQDTVYDLESKFVDDIAERVGRGTEAHFTTGTGSSQPNGIVTAATVGVTAAAVDDVTTDELFDLQHSVDPAYRMREGTGWMFNDSTLKVLRKKKDGDGQYVWQPGLAAREVNTLLGDPYTVNQEMADLGTSNKPILYGDISKYVIRDAGQMRIRRLNERFAENDQVAFLALSRHGGDLLDAGQNPVQVIQNS